MPILLKVASVSEKTCLSVPSVYRLAANGLFPKPVRIGPHSSVWPADEVDALIRARIAGKTDVEIRELVAALHEKRKMSA